MIGEGATLRFQMQLGDKTDDGITGHISPADNRVPQTIQQSYHGLHKCPWSR